MENYEGNGTFPKDCRVQFQQAEAEYEAALENDKKYKEQKKRERFDSLSESDKKLINEINNTDVNGFGRGLRSFLFIVFCALFAVAWFFKVQDTGIEVLVYVCIATIISSILSFLLVYIFNGKARTRSKRINEISKHKSVSAYFSYCKEVDAYESEDTKEAYNNYEKARRDLFLDVNKDTVFVYAPASRTEDTITLYKYLSLFLDGNMYAEQLRTGITQIKVSSDYHTFRFVQHTGPKNQDGVVAAYREGYHGASNTTSEFSCQIDMHNRLPAAIILGKKDNVIVIEDLTLDDYKKYFE